jgi:hypothetical protein
MVGAIASKRTGRKKKWFSSFKFYLKKGVKNDWL